MVHLFLVLMGTLGLLSTTTKKVILGVIETKILKPGENFIINKGKQSNTFFLVPILRISPEFFRSCHPSHYC